MCEITLKTNTFKCENIWPTICDSLTNEITCLYEKIFLCIITLPNKIYIILQFRTPYENSCK